MDTYKVDSSIDIGSLFSDDVEDGTNTTNPTPENKVMDTPKKPVRKTRAKKESIVDIDSISAEGLVKKILSSKDSVKVGKQTDVKKVGKQTKQTIETSRLNPDEDHKASAESKQNMLQVIERYGNNDRFGKYLKTKGFSLCNQVTLSKKSNTELEELVNRVRFCINTKNSTGISDTVLMKLVHTGETVVTENSGGEVVLTGLTERLWSNDKFLDLLETLKLEYMSFINIDYRLQLIAIISTTAYEINASHQLTRKDNTQTLDEFQ
jgi:hypothetical protein